MLMATLNNRRSEVTKLTMVVGSERYFVVVVPVEQEKLLGDLPSTDDGGGGGGGGGGGDGGGGGNGFFALVSVVSFFACFGRHDAKTQLAFPLYIFL